MVVTHHRASTWVAIWPSGDFDEAWGVARECRQWMVGPSGSGAAAIHLQSHRRQEQSFLMGIEDSSCGSYADDSLLRKSAVDVDMAELEAKGKENGMKCMIARNGSMSWSEDNVQVETALDCGDLRSSIHSRHNSLNTDGSSRLNEYEVGLDKSVGDDVLHISTTGLWTGQSSQKCPPVPRVSSSQDVVSDENSLAFVKQNSSTSLATSDEILKKPVLCGTEAANSTSLDPADRVPQA
ncbi:hypothetical protein F3Y22_tig00111841pilonHSYRG00198 [Hibiscus syriacus]|uniref:Uncharacterized protein n=1 Tax=Hibiscus syriacus TaxID=106335 RepID=A0A6A2XA84_HIBSY|nr:hypothetical protein F3Y22_tig00111841pilonHSYRG00198 [Hibiscus syriacus]